MGRLNVHIDEGVSSSGDDIYRISMVLHDHADDVDAAISRYEQEISLSGLPDVAFHMVDLLHGHGDYEGMSVALRKRLLYRFAALVCSLPVKIAVLEVGRVDKLENAQLRSKLEDVLRNFITSGLEWFQQFEEVHVYYDGGRSELGAAVRSAFDCTLARDVARYKHPAYRERRLCQVADYACYLAYAFGMYENGFQTSTHERFLGKRRVFKKNLYSKLQDKGF